MDLLPNEESSLSRFHLPLLLLLIDLSGPFETRPLWPSTKCVMDEDAKDTAGSYCGGDIGMSLIITISSVCVSVIPFCVYIVASIVCKYLS